MPGHGWFRTSYIPCLSTQELCPRPTFLFRPRHGWLIVSEQDALVFTLIKWNGDFGVNRVRIRFWKHPETVVKVINGRWWFKMKYFSSLIIIILQVINAEFKNNNSMSFECLMTFRRHWNWWKCNNETEERDDTCSGGGVLVVRQEETQCEALDLSWTLPKLDA